MFNFFGSDGSVIQSDHVCKFKHCDTTRALTTLETSPIRQPRLPSPLTDGAVGMRRKPIPVGGKNSNVCPLLYESGMKAGLYQATP